MKRGSKHSGEAYKSLLHLRGLPLSAAEELFYVDLQIEIEKRLLSQRTHGVERHLDDQKNVEKKCPIDPQALRKRKLGRRSNTKKR